MRNTLKHVHPTHETVASIELTPPHDERIETSAYRAARHRLIVEQNISCAVCGIRRSDGAEMEAHHFPIERSLLEACDPAKVGQRFPQVHDAASLETFVDSEANLLVLCATHHRDPQLGIHHLLAQDWAILPFLRTGYQVAATPETAAATLAHDEQIAQREKDTSPDGTQPRTPESA